MLAGHALPVSAAWQGSFLHCPAAAGTGSVFSSRTAKKKERQDLHPDVLIDGKLASPGGFEPPLTA